MILSHEKTQLVRKLAEDAILSATDKTIRQKIGDQDAVKVAINIHFRLAET